MFWNGVLSKHLDPRRYIKRKEKNFKEEFISYDVQNTANEMNGTCSRNFTS